MRESTLAYLATAYPIANEREFGSNIRHLRREIKQHYVHGRLQQATDLQQARIVMGSVLARTDGYDEDMYFDLLRRTRHLTTYSNRTNIEKLLDNARQDASLGGHIESVVGVYADADADSDAYDFMLSDEARRLLEYANYVVIDDCIVYADDTFRCESCGEHFRTEEVVPVYATASEAIAGDGSSYCRTCAENDSDVNYCHISGMFYLSDRNDTGETEDTAQPFWVEYCTSTGLVTEEEEEDEDGDEITLYYRADNANRRAGVLVGYHSALRPWNVIPECAIGVELEVGFPDEEDQKKLLREFVGARGRFKDRPFSCESDGSLRGHVPNGMEIISDPLTLEQGYQAADAPWPWLLKTLYAYGARGWEYRAYAGIHVNMDIRHLTPADVMKYAVFINNAHALSKFIAGRTNIYSGQYYERNRMLLRANDCHTAVFSNGKYSPVHRRPGGRCIETRIFGSNIRYEGFMACVEYCVAVMDFVQTLEDIDVFSPTISSEFRNWLGEKTDAYPNLTARLGIVAHPLYTATPSTAKITPLLAVA